jgi:hypothetical protein
VCGNREWTCVKTVDAWMRAIFFAAAKAGHDEFILIEGEADGADTIAAAIFDHVIKGMFSAVPDGRFNVDILRFPVHAHEWQTLGKRAGIIRNQRMFDEGKPTRCCAFGRLEKTDGSDSGTGNMVKVCNRGGIVVTVVPRPGVYP